MFRLTATIPDDLPGPKNLRTLATRLKTYLRLDGDSLQAHPDCGLFSVTKKTQEEIQAVLENLQARGIRVGTLPHRVTGEF